MLIRIKGCVGERNYKYFLAFLLSHSLMCLYGFCVALQVALTIMDKERLWNMRFRSSSTGQEYAAGYRVLGLYFLTNYNWLTFLIIICFVMFSALLLFFMYHLYQINRGMTTSENSKVSYALRGLGYKMEDLIKRSEEKKGLLNEREREEVQKQIAQCERTAAVVLRLYDQKNLVNNLKEILRA